LIVDRALPVSIDLWSKAAFTVMGGVVGKVWEFCKSVPFRGFHAGGGQGYDEMAQPRRHDGNKMNSEDGENLKNTTLRAPGSLPQPGQYPETAFVSDYVDGDSQSLASPRAAKRRHIEKSDSLGSNWVMVGRETPARQVKSTVRYNLPAPVGTGRKSLASTAGRPVLRGNVRRPHTTGNSHGSHAGSPALQSCKPASFASLSPYTRSRESSSVGYISNKPANTEAQRWAAKKKREEKVTDDSMTRFNARLQAMIREGKEALGTKIEVEDDELVDLGTDHMGFVDRLE
jgi:hypothetical protein